tara:strand:+ start:141 stop:335 length:195 start_codon:yes stop_codon:yes gene_type:complete
MGDEHWLDEELVKIAEQVDSEADLSFELDIALWLHEILKKNKIVITKEMWKKHRLEIGWEEESE